MHSVGMPTGESERVSRPVSGLRKARAGAQIGQQQDKFIDWQGFLLQSGRDGVFGCGGWPPDFATGFAAS